MAREPSEFLTPAEVKDLAGGTPTVEAQLSVLQAEGIPCRIVGKRLVVSRFHVRQWLESTLPGVPERPSGLPKGLREYWRKHTEEARRRAQESGQCL